MNPTNPLDVLVPGTHYKAYLVASLAMGSSPRAAIQHYGLPEEQVQWAMNFHLENGPAIYDAIDKARRIGHELGAQNIEDAIARMQARLEPTEEDILEDIRDGIARIEAGEAGRPAMEVIDEIEANILLDGVKTALSFGRGAFEALAAQYSVARLLVVGDFVDDKLPAGRPVVFVYDPAEHHTVKDYVGLARSLHNLVGYPTCLVNRQQVIDEMAEAWVKIVELASWQGRVIVPRERGEDRG